MESQTVTFEGFSEEVTNVYDPDSQMLTILTGDRMVGSMFIGSLEPAAAPDVVEAEPIVEPEEAD